MLELRLNQLKPGMVLSRDVTNFSGILLLKSGRPLQPKDIKNFKAWGITEAFVQESRSQETDQQEELQVDPKLLAEATKESAVLFHHTNADHPIIKELKRLCILSKAHRKSDLEGAHEY